MDSQHGTVDQTVDRLSIAGSSADPVEYRAGPAMSQLSGSPSFQGVSTMGRVAPSDEAPAASLVGSLSVFDLSDVLAMLSSTTQTGELQVVGDSVDGRVWLDRGKLSSAQVGTAATITEAVFDLACLTEGWFYFTSGPASSNGQPPVAVDSVLGEVRPQVDEWKGLREEVPLEAVVALCPDPPGDDVQIRSDQWRVLTTIGNSGRTVRSVLEMIGGDQIVGLRTLRGPPLGPPHRVGRCRRPGRRRRRVVRGLEWAGRRSRGIRDRGPGAGGFRRSRSVGHRPGRVVRRPGRGGHHAAPHRRRSLGADRPVDRPGRQRRGLTLPAATRRFSSGCSTW